MSQVKHFEIAVDSPLDVKDSSLDGYLTVSMYDNNGDQVKLRIPHNIASSLAQDFALRRMHKSWCNVYYMHGGCNCGFAKPKPFSVCYYQGQLTSDTVLRCELPKHHSGVHKLTVASGSGVFEWETRPGCTRSPAHFFRLKQITISPDLIKDDTMAERQAGAQESYRRAEERQTDVERKTMAGVFSVNDASDDVRKENVGDHFIDRNDKIWLMYAWTDMPLASFARVDAPDISVQHVIGCLNYNQMGLRKLIVRPDPKLSKE